MRRAKCCLGSFSHTPAGKSRARPRVGTNDRSRPKVANSRVLPEAASVVPLITSCCDRIVTSRISLPLALCLLAVLLSSPACKRPTKRRPGAETKAKPAAIRSVALTPQPAQARATAALVARGKQLVAQYQCNRCHAGSGHGTPPLAKNCVGCHAEILADRFPPAGKVKPDVVAKWKREIVDLTMAPSLTSTGARVRRAWLAKFLQRPHDLRPKLSATMPRFVIDAEAARAIAAYLAPQAAPATSAVEGDLRHGRAVLAAKGCMTCHTFSGLPSPVDATQIPVKLSAEATTRGIMLAPDLRHARERLRYDTLVAWLREPTKLKRDSAMPDLKLSAAEARDAAAFILRAYLAPAKLPTVPARLPLLKRAVSWAEVEKKLFKRICWHCHSEPAYARGDGGPGNTGGFGFKPRGVNLASYEAVASGRLDDKGERESLFRPLASGPLKGVPRIAAVLLARQREVSGKPVPGLRGMPLGLPPMSPQDIQLVESWVAQGRPR
ncbi:MAG: c-type cytochrome [Myxococcales bacterium]|nr:c-type cytochrome [Myxococcales bacterium]